VIAASKEDRMLHMIVNTHNPESCAFRSPADGAAPSDPFDRLMDKVAEAHGITIRGSWVNRSHSSATSCMLLQVASYCP
jgi:hypothetical protein